MREEQDKIVEDRHYAKDRVSPWLFIVIFVITVIVIVAGVFQFEPLTRVVNWLAVVL